MFDAFKKPSKTFLIQLQTQTSLAENLIDSLLYIREALELPGVSLDYIRDTVNKIREVAKSGNSGNARTCYNAIIEITDFNEELANVLGKMITPFKDKTGIDFNKSVLDKARADGWTSSM